MSNPTIITAVRSVATSGNEVLAAFKLSNGQGIIANSDGLHLHQTDTSVSWYEILEFLESHQMTFMPDTPFKPAPRIAISSLGAFNDSTGFGALEPHTDSWTCPHCGREYSEPVVTKCEADDCPSLWEAKGLKYEEDKS
jgi:hypothetical protein